MRIDELGFKDLVTDREENARLGVDEPSGTLWAYVYAHRVCAYGETTTDSRDEAKRNILHRAKAHFRSKYGVRVGEYTSKVFNSEEELLNYARENKFSQIEKI